VKKLIPVLALTLLSATCFAQQKSRNDKRSEKKQKIAAIIRQEEEGVLVYKKQTAFGLQLRTNGYGLFFEIGRRKTQRWTNVYAAELTEIKHPKEEKGNNGNGNFSNSFVYGKINNFYQFKLGFGREYIFGQKGNKNGVAVIGLAQGGLSLGLLRPYYLDIQEGADKRAIKYESADSTKFLGGDNAVIIGSSGIGKGWNEIKMQPGAYLKVGLRFDFNKYNERIQAVQVGFSVEAYGSGIPQLAFNKPKQLFFQGHLAYVFGGRK
jgi:ribosomal protein S24E